MEYEETGTVTGSEFGAEGVDELVGRAEAVATWERQRIELSNESPLVAKRAEYVEALEEERELKTRLARLSPVSDSKTRRRRIAMHWIVATVLIISGFLLALLTLEPYRLGLKGAVYCIGIALTVPVLVEMVLDSFASDTFRKVVMAVACLGGLTSMILLATIRGNLLMQQIRQNSVSATIEGDEPQKSATQNNFYEDTVPLLQYVMGLLAFSMELGAGLAAHEAERMSNTGEGEYETLKANLRATHDHLAGLAREIVRLQNEAPVFVARFWRDFYWSMFKGTLRNAAKRFVLPSLVVLSILCSQARWTPEAIDLVVAVDLTKSVDRKGPDGQTAFAKNIEAVTRLLGRLPAGSQVTVLGITSNSFAQPYVILKASLRTDAGYFGEKLTSGRQEIVRAWKKRSAQLQPEFMQTDIFGALILAGELFAEHTDSQRRILVIYSDMEQATKDMNLEPQNKPRRKSIITEIERSPFVAHLQDVEVYCRGVHAPNEQPAHWKELREFWEIYFRNAGGKLKSYSAFRDAQELTLQENR